MKLLLYLTLSFLVLSCTGINKEENENEPSHSRANSNLEPIDNQELAFVALNELQTSTDQMNRLYSTFPYNDHPCLPADTSYTISQKDFLTAMNRFVSMQCTNLSVEKRDSLAATAVLAQEEYLVLHCLGNADISETGMTGTWVIPNVLGSRDVVLVW
ncbi:MAG: hypothetical protein N4A46_01025 [Schleiferiaceae bacterium]|jgi:hypothetical protein|nr:hypothetical protein [Schleiferiaceae bacterium]